MIRDMYGHRARKKHFLFQSVTNAQLRSGGALLSVSESMQEGDKDTCNVAGAFILFCPLFKRYPYLLYALKRLYY